MRFMLKITQKPGNYNAHSEKTILGFNIDFIDFLNTANIYLCNAVFAVVISGYINL